MGTLVSYQLEDGVALLRLDDGKVNALSTAMLGEINAALDQAAADQAVVVLAGRPGVFSAGFDLPVVRGGGDNATVMVRAGFELAARVLAFPTPVVVACTGHAIAMGAFLLLSGDYLIGAAGPYKLTANEVAIGLAVPHSAVEILRQRLTPAAANRALILAEPFTPDNAVQAGFLDQVVAPEDVVALARTTALAYTKLHLPSHATTKLRARRSTLDALATAVEADFATVTFA